MTEVDAQLPAARRRSCSAGRRRADQILRAWCAEMVGIRETSDALLQPFWAVGADPPDHVFRAACSTTPRWHELRGLIGNAQALTPEALLAKARAILAEYRWNVPEDRTDAAFVAWSLARDLVAAMEAGPAADVVLPSGPASVSG